MDHGSRSQQRRAPSSSARQENRFAARFILARAFFKIFAKICDLYSRETLLYVLLKSKQKGQYSEDYTRTTPLEGPFVVCVGVSKDKMLLSNALAIMCGQESGCRMHIRMWMWMSSLELGPRLGRSWMSTTTTTTTSRPQKKYKQVTSLFVTSFV